MSTKQLQATPINKAFLFLYNGVVRGKIKVPPIMDTGDQEAEQWPMISGREYMEKAMDEQIAHESTKPALLAALQGLLRVMPNGDMSDEALESMIEEGFAPEIRQEGEAIKAAREALQQAQV